MRVLLSTYGSRGDIEPVVGLAAALVAQGADARVNTPPDAEFIELIESVGATPVPFGQSARELVKGIEPGSKPHAQLIAAEMVAMRLGLADAASTCDALLATGLHPAGAREVAERAGIPYVFAAFQPRILPSPHHRPHSRPGRPFPPDETDNRVLWDIDAENLQTMYGEPLNSRRAAMGLPPVDDVRGHVFTDRPWLAADPVLAPWPETADLDVVRTGAWFLPDERPLPDELEDFIDAGEPPVYVGFGSMPTHVLKGTAEAAIEAVRSHGRRLLVSSGWAELDLIGDDADCFLVGELNHRALFTRVAAVVHHGGAGTTATAARTGAPQVVAPQMADQPYWAERVAALGIGAAHRDEEPTVESMSAALDIALAPETDARAKAVAAQVRTDGATVAAGLLADLTR